MSHIVTAAYVTLRVGDDAGQEVLTGFYRDAVLPAGVNRDDLQRHLRKGMVVDQAAGPEPASAPSGPDTPSGPDGSAPAKPGGRDSREKWATYARDRGATDAELAPVDEGGLTRDQLRDKYGA